MPKHEKVMNILAKETGGKSYKAHKYSLDNSERPSVDYGNSENCLETKGRDNSPQNVCRFGIIS